MEGRKQLVLPCGLIHACPEHEVLVYRGRRWALVAIPVACGLARRRWKLGPSPALHALHEAEHDEEHRQQHEAHEHERFRVHAGAPLVRQLQHVVLGALPVCAVPVALELARKLVPESLPVAAAHAAEVLPVHPCECTLGGSTQMSRGLIPPALTSPRPCLAPCTEATGATEWDTEWSTKK